MLFLPLKQLLTILLGQGSCVCAAALDLRKAFDSANHFKLYITLLNSGVPLIVINVLVNWYMQLTICFSPLE